MRFEIRTCDFCGESSTNGGPVHGQSAAELDRRGWDTVRDGLRQLDRCPTCAFFDAGTRAAA